MLLLSDAHKVLFLKKIRLLLLLADAHPRGMGRSFSCHYNNFKNQRFWTYGRVTTSVQESPEEDVPERTVYHNSLAEEDIRVICDSGGGRGHFKECVLRKCRGRRRYRSNGSGCHGNGTAISSRRKEKGFSFGAVMSYILPEAAEKPPIDIWSGAAQLEKRVAPHTPD
ncbi:hypothetical protein AVEN_205479-1 [Araneus ventricosus]|uniref:Uncharacterized protein n=1 Tax=Araneus ventricosus TaxID=182803 RepID=A0A4Y2CBP8_ARAVE|nr:hypothetical protein AVEN_205479-1 [Araneus ventricosus]